MTDPIIVADGGVRCEYCGETFDGDDVATTVVPSTMLYQCPECQRWSER